MMNMTLKSVKKYWHLYNSDTLKAKLPLNFSDFAFLIASQCLIILRIEHAIIINLGSIMAKGIILFRLKELTLKSSPDELIDNSILDQIIKQNFFRSI